MEHATSTESLTEIQDALSDTMDIVKDIAWAASGAGREGELNAPPHLERLQERIGEGLKRGDICIEILPLNAS